MNEMNEQKAKAHNEALQKIAAMAGIAFEVDFEEFATNLDSFGVLIDTMTHDDEGTEITAERRADLKAHFATVRRLYEAAKFFKTCIPSELFGGEPRT